MSKVVLPSTGQYTLANARLHRSLTPSLEAETDPDGFVLADLSIADGKIAWIAVAANGRSAARPAVPPATHAITADVAVLNLAGRIVLPSFVDCHTHLDKGHIWPRKANPNGSFPGALGAAEEDRSVRWTEHDVERRMDFALRTAYAHGTCAIRTHLDSVAPSETLSWPVFETMRSRWQGRVELQAACLFGIEAVRDAAWFDALVRRVAQAKGIVGAVTYMLPDLDELLDRVFRAAINHGLDLDFHADETGDLAAVSLRKIAEAALRTRFEGKVLVGHCCALSRQPEAEVLDTLDKAAKAGLAVVSLPMCNLYLQDRRHDGTTPRWRGVTLLHEMKARGMAVAVASDNTRDPFHAYGDLDMLEVYRMATRILHLDHPVGDWPRVATSTPAAVMRLPEAGTLKAGGAADFTIFRGRSWTELLSRPESDRMVVRGGVAIQQAVPDYAELDDLMV